MEKSLDSANDCAHTRPCDPEAFSQLLSGDSSFYVSQKEDNVLMLRSEQAIMARDLMEAKEELRKLREARDENVRLLSDAKFSLMRSEQMQASNISDCLVRKCTSSNEYFSILVGWMWSLCCLTRAV